MFFSNLQAYRLTQPLSFAPTELEAALQTKIAREPASQELATYGFTAPYGKGEAAPLLHVSHGYMLLATRKAERLLPGSVVREEVTERVEAIELEQHRKVYKKERDQIKDDVIQAFLPRAFVRRSRTFAAIDLESGLILVNSSSPSRAEDLLSTLREVMGTLPVRPLTARVSPAATMTAWVQAQKAANDFYLLDTATLSDTHEDGGSIAAKRQDLTSDEIRLHLDTGKQVTRIALAYQDKLRFVLDEKMAIKSIRFEELLLDQASQDGGEEAAGQFDASFVLMMLTFRKFIPSLLEALGGEEIPQGL